MKKTENILFFLCLALNVHYSKIFFWFFCVTTFSATVDFVNPLKIVHFSFKRAYIEGELDVTIGVLFVIKTFAIVEIKVFDSKTSC